MATQLATTDEQTRAIRPTTPEADHFNLMQRQAWLFASSPLIPDSLRKGSPEQAMANCYIAMTIADRMGEDRMTVMQNIHIIHGNAGFKTKYMIARANASGVFSDDIDWEIDRTNPANLSATAFATRAKDGRRIEMTVDMAMAKAEGWTSNKKYQTMPEVMLRYRSASFLINMYAPHVMLGYKTVEEVEDIGFAAMPARGERITLAMLADHSDDEPFGRADADHGDQHDDLETTTRARRTADDLIKRCAGAKIPSDLANIEAVLASHQAAMPDDFVTEVEAAISDARNALN